MLLSIAMMVKNEEKHLRDCLTSIQPILNSIDSELIIVDTGSTDSSVEIAKQFTDKLYFHEWNNDFSAMRNITINYSTGEWIFILDGDEVIEDCTPIIEFFKSEESKKYNSAQMVGINYIKSNDKSNFINLDTIRFFRNDGTFRYEGAVHNQPQSKEPLKDIKATLYHYGYVNDDKELMERKFKRTATILKSELEKDPNNIYYRYQLSTSYSMHGDNVEALEEIKKAYDLCQQEGISKADYRFVYMSYAKCLYALRRFSEIEAVCNEGISITKEESLDKIDLYYFMASSYQEMGKKEAAIKAYNLYIDLMGKYNSKSLKTDASIINNTVAFLGRAYKMIALMHFNDKDYENAKLAVERINDKEVLVNIVKLVIGTYLELGEVKLLHKYYYDVIVDGNKDVEEDFFYYLEEKKLEVNEKIKSEVEKEYKFSDNERYSKLNYIRCLEDKELINEKIVEFVNEYDMNEYSLFAGDILYIAMKNDISFTEIVNDISYSTINTMLDYCNKRYEKFIEVMEEYVLNHKTELTYNERRIYNVLLRRVNIINKFEGKYSRELFNFYVDNGIYLLRQNYSDFVIENEKVREVKSEEDAFFLYLLKAFNNEKEYISYLKKALLIYPPMGKGIEFLIDEYSNGANEVDIEMKQLKDELLNNIEILILANEFDAVKEIIDQYKKFIGTDIEILNMETKLKLNSINSLNNFKS